MNTIRVGENFCVQPFIGLNCLPDGSYSPCCSLHEDIPKNKYNVSYSFQEAWESEEFHRLRIMFIRNERPAQCGLCWEKEDRGAISERIEQNKWLSPTFGLTAEELIDRYQDGPNKGPLRLQVRLSDKCNLKCRICSPFQSSSWKKETEVNSVLGAGTNYRKENIENVINWLPDIQDLLLLGGEPLLAKENIQLLELIKDKGFSKKMTLNIITNGTIFSKDICRIVKSFRSTRIFFSIDDIAERFNYQRKGADFEKVMQNLKRYQVEFTNDPTVYLEVAVTVSLFNVYYIPELLSYLTKELSDYEIGLHILDTPEEMSIWNIPDIVKEKVLEKYRQRKVLNFDSIMREGHKVQNIVSYMLSKNMNKSAKIPFIENTKNVDEIRKENYEEVFPEFWGLLNIFTDKIVSDEDIN